MVPGFELHEGRILVEPVLLPGIGEAKLREFGKIERKTAVITNYYSNDNKLIFIYIKQHSMEFFR